MNGASASSLTRTSTSMLALVVTEQREQVLAGIWSENPKAAAKRKINLGLKMQFDMSCSDY